MHKHIFGLEEYERKIIEIRISLKRLRKQLILCLLQLLFFLVFFFFMSFPSYLFLTIVFFCFLFSFPSGLCSLFDFFTFYQQHWLILWINSGEFAFLTFVTTYDTTSVFLGDFYHVSKNLMLFSIWVLRASLNTRMITLSVQ